VSRLREAAHRGLVLVGGGALLAAMAIDGIAVIGRHVGWPLLGSIEIIQAAVLVAGCAALLVATIAGVHARVHLIVDRLPAGLRNLFERGGVLAGALLFVALAVASAWIAADLWQGHEESEWLQVPYRPLRVLAIAASVAVAGAFAVAAVRRKDR
jgi:TRAP-type transport system small permease protein